MKVQLLAIALAAVITAPAAFADVTMGKTRAEVKQELIEARRNGLNYVTEASYPDVARVYAARFQGADAKRVNTPAEGVVVSTTDARPVDANSGVRSGSECVGPVSFCKPYFGS